MPLTKRGKLEEIAYRQIRSMVLNVRFEVSLRYPRDYNMKVLPRLKKKKLMSFKKIK